MQRTSRMKGGSSKKGEIFWAALFDNPPCLGNWNCLVRRSKYPNFKASPRPNIPASNCNSDSVEKCRKLNQELRYADEDLSRAVSDGKMDCLEALEILKKRGKLNERILG